MSFRRAIIVVVSLCLLATGVMADLITDTLQDFRPHRIVTEQVRDEPHRYWWVQSPLRRVGNDFALDREEDVDVRYSRWQVVEFDRSHDQRNLFRQVLSDWEADGYEELFRCEGASCGNSQHWANNVFGESILYGLNRHQHYSTGLVGDDIRVLYAVRRGTQLNYVYWLEAVRTDPTDRLAETLETGQALLATSFPPAVWRDVLENNPDWQLILVGHNYDGDLDTARAKGERAAQSMSNQWQEQGIDEGQIVVESVGYLAPSGASNERVTVVLPPRFQ
ncbi:MAG: DUF4892 domain-containing protein [Natronospirillum sp.]